MQAMFYTKENAFSASYPENSGELEPTRNAPQDRAVQDGGKNLKHPGRVPGTKVWRERGHSAAATLMCIQLHGMPS